MGDIPTALRIPADAPTSSVERRCPCTSEAAREWQSAVCSGGSAVCSGGGAWPGPPGQVCPLAGAVARYDWSIIADGGIDSRCGQPTAGVCRHGRAESLRSWRHAGRCVGGGPGEWWRNQVAIWVREVKPSLTRMCSTWASAVRRETTSLVAISLFDMPWAISGATSRSRRVSSLQLRLAGKGRGCGRRRRRLLAQCIGQGLIEAEALAVLDTGVERPLAEDVLGLGLGPSTQVARGTPAAEPPTDRFPHLFAHAEHHGGTLGVVVRRGDPAQHFDAPRDADLITERALEPESFPHVCGCPLKIVLEPSGEGKMPQCPGVRPPLTIFLTDSDGFLAQSHGTVRVAEHADDRAEVTQRQGGKGVHRFGGSIMRQRPLVRLGRFRQLVLEPFRHPGERDRVTQRGLVMELSGQAGAFVQGREGVCGIALGGRDPADDPQRLDPLPAGPRVLGNCPVQPVPAIAHRARNPVPVQRAGHPQTGAGLPVFGEAELQGRRHVGRLGTEPVQPFHLAGPEPVRFRLLAQPQVVVPMPATDNDLLTAGEPLPAELADRLQHPVAGHSGILAPDQQGLVHQAGHTGEHLLAGRTSSAHTSSAAARSNPPAKTDSLAHTVRSSSEHRSKLHSTAARNV